MRLSEMGVPRFLVAEAVSMIVSQRLIRKVHDCKMMAPPTPEEMEVLKRLGAEDIQEVAHAMGCGGCAGLGYRGRLAVAEVLVPSPGVREVVAAGRSRSAIVDECLKAEWKPIIQDGIRHLRDGSTTVAELARVLAEDDSDDEASETAAMSMEQGHG